MSDFTSHGVDWTDALAGASMMFCLRTVATSDPQTDTNGEEYLDLRNCGAFDDENKVRPLLSRQLLWCNFGGDAGTDPTAGTTSPPHPELNGRLVFFDYARPLLSALKLVSDRL